MNQGRGLQRLAGHLQGHLLRGQFAQFVVDERQQLRTGARVALLDRGQDFRSAA
jgi:hypothetical protein